MIADVDAQHKEIARHYGEIMRVRRIIQDLAALSEDEFCMTVVEDPSVIFELWDITDKSQGKFLIDFLGFQPETAQCGPSVFNKPTVIEAKGHG